VPLVGAHAGALHPGQERSAAAPAGRRPGRRGPTRESLIALREDIDDLRARLRETEELPHRRKYLLMVAAGHLHKLLDLHLELVDEAERELAREA
jgi:hypothetical protein